MWDTDCILLAACTFVSQACLDSAVLTEANLSGARFGESPTVRAHRSSIRALAVSTDGKILCSGSVDNAIHAWSLHAGKLKVRYRAADASIRGNVCIS